LVLVSSLALLLWLRCTSSDGLSSSKKSFQGRRNNANPLKSLRGPQQTQIRLPQPPQPAQPRNYPELVEHVAIIVPYRDRSTQLDKFLKFLPTFLQRKKKLHFGIYIVNQSDELPFNRGMLLNTGFREAQMDFPWNCLIFHDVDLLPLNETNPYRCSEFPLLMASRMDKWGWQMPYASYFGGVGAMTTEQFEQVNGFSNMFWGWGSEDDDMQMRLRFHGFTIGQLDKEGFYTMAKHAQEPINQKRHELFKTGKKRFAWDGLSNLTYELLSRDVQEKCTIMHVRLERT